MQRQAYSQKHSARETLLQQQLEALTQRNQDLEDTAMALEQERLLVTRERDTKA
jgi:uncharacterized protein YjiK